MVVVVVVMVVPVVSAGWCCEKRTRWVRSFAPSDVSWLDSMPWLRCAAGSTVVMAPRRSGIWQHDRPPSCSAPFTCHLFLFVPPPYPDIVPKDNAPTEDVLSLARSYCHLAAARPTVRSPCHPASGAWAPDPEKASQSTVVTGGRCNQYN